MSEAYKQRRRERKKERQIRRGKLISMVHPHKFDQFRNHLSEIDFSVAIGHGTLVRQNTFIDVPKRVMVVFTTRPGYWGDMTDALDPKFLNIFMNPDKIRRFFKGTLPKSELPDLVTQRKWNWKSHVYPPESKLPEHELEFFDDEAGKPIDLYQHHGIHAQYDNIAGLYHLPGPREYHGIRMTLSQMMNLAQAKADSTGRFRVLIFSGCRGDPVMYTHMRIVQALTRTPSGKLLLKKPQTYRIPKHEDEFIEKLQQLEKNMSTSMFRTRQFNENFIKKRILSLKNENKQKFISRYKNFFKNKNAQQYIKNVKLSKFRQIVRNVRKSIIHPIRMQQIRSRAASQKRKNDARNRFKKTVANVRKSIIHPIRMQQIRSRASQIRKNDARNRFKKTVANVIGKKRNIRSKLYETIELAKLQNQQKRNMYLNMDVRLLRRYLRNNNSINDPYIKRLGNRIKQLSEQTTNFKPLLNRQPNMSDRNKFVMYLATRR